MTQSAIQPRLLNVEEAAKLLGRTPNALRTMIRRGVVPGVVRIGNRIQLDRERLHRWIDELQEE